MSVILITVFSLFELIQSVEMPKNDKGEYEIKEVVSLTGTADKLYSSSLIAMTDIFKDSEEVIEYKSQEEGIIIGKFNVVTTHSGMGPKNHYFKFKIRLAFKENKYKIQVSFIDHKAIWTSVPNECSCGNDILVEKCAASMCIGKKEWNVQRKNSHNDLLLAIESLKTSIESNIKSLNGGVDDW